MSKPNHLAGLFDGLVRDLLWWREASNCEMRVVTPLRIQVLLVTILFAASVVALVFSAFRAVVPRERELLARAELREASHQMAELARRTPDIRNVSDEPSPDVDRRLAAIGRKVMLRFGELEGGFYFGGTADRFSGFAKRDPPPALEGPVRNDPPPRETPLIRVQAQQSLLLPRGQFQIGIRDVGLSRVAVLTEPVDEDRPARLATWVMCRLIHPKEVGMQVRSYQVSIGLALAGLGMAALLAANLGRVVRRQDAERNELQKELRRAEHLAALGTLLAGVAHEVRNPLAAIRSTVQLWERLPTTTRTPESLLAVVAATDRINAIVTQLLHFAKTDRSLHERLEIHGLLNETLDLVSAQAAAQSVQIMRQFSAEQTVILGSGQLMCQVFLNLTVNALQAMKDGGSLACITTNLRHAIAVTFCDTGPGITKSDRERLFEPFFTTRSDGTGLGLAISREIVLQHDGRLELVDRQEPGAVFRVVLPVTATLDS